MNTAPALEWLIATFDTRRRKAFDRDFRIGPDDSRFKSVMDAGHRCTSVPATTTTP